MTERDRRTDLLVVLAGGRSARMGSDKALVELGAGEPLALRALRRLAPLAPRAVLVRSGPFAPLPDGVELFADPEPGGGPLQALRALFKARPAARCFVAPCDLPWLEPALYAPLAAAAGDTGVACARRDGRLEPLVAVWSAPAAARLAAAEPEAGTKDAVQAALARLDAVAVDFQRDDPRFQNVNTPGDLRAARALELAAAPERAR